MIFGINTTCDISKLYKNFEISLVVFMPNITTEKACYYLYQATSYLIKYLTVRDGGSVTWKRAVNNYSRTRLGNWNSEGKRKTVRVGEEFEFSG